MTNRFLDNLDGKWNSTISDIYTKESEVPFLINEENNIKVILDKSSVDIDALSDGAYTELYKDKYNPDINIVIYLYLSYLFTEMHLLFGIEIYNQNEPFEILSKIQIRNAISKPKNKHLSSETILYDKNFLDKFIDRSTDALNKNLKSYNRDLIPEEYIKKLKQLINETE